MATKNINSHFLANKDIKYTILSALLLLSFAFSIRYSIVSFIPFLNSDNASTNLIYPQIVEKYGLFFNGWYGSEDVIMSRPVLITVLVYKITGDWIVSAITTVCVMKTVTLLLVFCLLRQLKFSHISIFSALIFLLCVNFPVNEGNAINGANGTDYSVLGALILSLIILRNALREEGPPKQRQLYFALYCVSVFLCGFFGFKLIAIAILPILLMDAYDIIKKAEGEFNYRHLLRMCTLAFQTLVITGAGFLAARYYNSLADEWGYMAIRLGSYENLLEGLQTHTKMLIEALGILVNGLSLSTLADLLTFAEFGLRAIMLIAAVWATQHLIKKTGDEINPIRNTVIYFTLVFAINYLFFALFLYYYAAPRQHFFIWFLIAVIIAFIVEHYGKKNVLRRSFAIVCVALLCAISLYNNNLKRYPALANMTTTPQHIAYYLVQEGYDGVYGTHWHSAVVAGASNLALSSGAFRWDAGFTPMKWLVDTRVFENTNGKWAILMTDEELASFDLHADEIDKKKFASGKWVHKVSDINIFEFSQNPVTFR